MNIFTKQGFIDVYLYLCSKLNVENSNDVFFTFKKSLPNFFCIINFFIAKLAG